MKLFLAVPLVFVLFVPMLASAGGRRGGDSTPTPTPTHSATPTSTPTATASSSPTATATPVPFDRFAFYYNPAGAPAGVPADAVPNAILGWNGISSNLMLTYATTGASASCGVPDGKNTISWRVNYHDALAVTCTLSNGEHDITISPLAAQYDVQTILQHEVGHAIGLVHSTVVMSIMYGHYLPHGPLPGPQPDDIRQVCNYYFGCP